jgi:hypothetical protein
MRNIIPFAGLFAAVLLSLGAASATMPATAPAGPTSITVDMEGGKSITLSINDLAKMPHEGFKATEHDGTVAAYSGVPLAAVLAKIDAPLGEKNLRGKNMALYLVAQGADGYKVIFSLDELDPGFGDRHIIVADQREGQPLGAKWGPLQIIVPQDKRQGRWVRLLSALHIRRAE